MSLLLTDEEISTLAAGVTLPRCQLRHLHAAGFVRARLERGRIILERTHYEAVCRGEFAPATKSVDTPRPQLRHLRKAANE